MSTPRGGRGARATVFARGAAGRGRGDGAPADSSSSSSSERPTHQVYARASTRARGAHRNGAARATTPTNVLRAHGTNARASTRARDTHTAATTPTSALAGGLNSTPFAQDDYAKRLDHIRAARPKLRERFINEGRMNPEGQMRLCDSVKLFGLCTDMCPEYERVRRIVEEDVKPAECTPGTEHLPRKQRIPDETRMVKAYTRSAAGMDVELVSEIRSPATCLKTLEYLMQRLDGDDFDFLHSWIWDRTRSVRKDLRTQRIESRTDINILLTCLERSARFFILSAHQMARSEREDYSHHQDLEQLNQTMTSLNERYADNRRVNYPSENEAEFFAYRLILAPLFSNTQHEDDLQGQPEHLRKNPRVKTAIVIYRAINAVILNKSSSFNAAQANWKRLWDLIKSPRVSYLMACAAEFSFQRVRHTILDTLWRAYRYGNQSRPQTIETWTVAKVRDAMGFDTNAEAVHFCEAYGFQFNQTNSGPTFLDVTARGFAKEPLLRDTRNKDQVFSQGIVEEKRRGRTFSAIVQAMSVEEAQRRNLVSDSIINEDTNTMAEHETSLFIPEARPVQNGVFMPPTGGPVKPTVNPFLPNTTPEIGSGAPKLNPFLTNQPAVPVAASGVATLNTFLQKALPSAQGSHAGAASGAAQPGLFDASKNSIKFSTSDATTMPSSSATSANAFQSAFSAAALPSTTTAASGVASQPFSFYTPATTTSTSSASTTPPLPTANSFSFVGAKKSAADTLSIAPLLSFTPAGSPAPTGPTPQELEKQKAEEEEARQRFVAAQAEARRQREQQEQAQRAEQQRIEAERQRLRLQEEEQNRRVREAQEARRREEEAQLAREQARSHGYQALAEDIMYDVNDGLMMQFVENLVNITVHQVMVAEKERKLEVVRQKQKAMADAMAHQRLLALQRCAMAKLLARAEKRKRDQKVRERRRRLKEQRAKMATMEEIGASGMPTPAASDVQADQLDTEVTFRRPQAPASARRARRTEERRGTPSSEVSRITDKTVPVQQPMAQAVLTPISMNSSKISNAGYSEAYRKSAAPIDRTETDWFTLRAEGFDPSMLRKRSFDATADENQPSLETKRARMSPSDTQPPMPQTTATSDGRARLDAMGHPLGRCTDSVQSATESVSFNGRSSLSKSTTMLIEQARQVLARSKASSPAVQHNYGRSVPILHRRTMSAQPSVLGRSAGATKDRAAYWNRPSRFVPKECYGQGASAVRDYRIKYGLSSPANTRPNSIEPLTVSLPIPTQMSYKPVKGYTQEQYSGEESSGPDMVDGDAEEDKVANSEDEESVGTTEEEYEGDEESNEEEAQAHRRQTHDKAWGHHEYNDQDGDLAMHDENAHYGDDGGYGNGQYRNEALNHYDGYTDDSEMESDDESETQYAAGAQLGQKKAASAAGGNCEEDAIELSD
ncbi:actin cytoskeleton and mitosis protein [Pleosporales sp. CAS-2024a]